MYNDLVLIIIGFASGVVFPDVIDDLGHDFVIRLIRGAMVRPGHVLQVYQDSLIILIVMNPYLSLDKARHDRFHRDQGDSQILEFQEFFYLRGEILVTFVDGTFVHTGQHEAELDIFLPNHPPKVFSSLCQRALSRNEELIVLRS